MALGGTEIIVPMVASAAAGALVDSDNPMRGAMLGGLGGAFLGPTVAGMVGPGAAASTAATEAGMSAAEASMAAQAAAAADLAGAPALDATGNALLGQQLEGMGTAGLQHYLGSTGVSPGISKAASFAAMGPQGAIQNLGIAGRAAPSMTGAMGAMNTANRMLNPAQGQQPRAMPVPMGGGTPPAPIRPQQSGMMGRGRPTRLQELQALWGR